MAKLAPAPTPVKKAATSTAKATAKDVSSVSANPRLVAAIKTYDEALSQTQSYLVDIATICQEEQLTRPEVVASLMEGRGIERSTAESQYSRMKKLITDPETLESVKSGDMTLSQARETTKKKQDAPSPKKAAENAEKKLATGITTVINAAKVLGTDLNTIINTIKAAGKKAGLK